MTDKSIKIRIVDSTSNFVSFKYLMSNSRSRVEKKEFMSNYQKGLFNVVNPEALKNLQR